MSRLLSAAVLLLTTAGLFGCSSAGPASGPASAGAAPTATPAPAVTLVSAPSSRTARPATTGPPSSTAASSPRSAPEATTTNTLPAPPRPSRPAPSTAGPLSKSALPVPVGWRTIARAGGSEEGYEGNGTWVHARDPRYAAQSVITLGCAVVTRDDYVDPVHALEGDYTKGQGRPGIGLVLQFSTPARARAYYQLYVQQVRACRAESSPLRTRVLPSARGLIDQRSYPDGDWTEVGGLSGSRLTLVILSDPGHRISRARSEALLHQIVP